MQYVTLLLIVCLGACSTPSDSTMQQVAVRSVPPGAACTVSRGGQVIGTVQPTPGTLAVDSSDKDLLVSCRKPGWQDGAGTVRAVYQGIGLGQLVTGGVARVIEDAAKSSDFRYDPAGALVTLPPG